ILKGFTEAGGNLIDTSDVYGAGLSERIIGSFLRSTDKKVFIATKLGRRQDKPFGWPQNFGYDMMKRQVESSLHNLGLSQLFLEQLHCIPIVELRTGKVFDHFRKLRDEKLIKFGALVSKRAKKL